jgi:hypothetical protein
MLFSYITHTLRREYYANDGPDVRHTIAEVKQRSKVGRWSGHQTFNFSSSYFGRHVKSLVPAAFAVVSTHQSALGRRVVDYGPFFLCVIH